MRPSRLRSQDGFTLVEVLIAMSVFMLILLGVFFYMRKQTPED